MSLTTPSRTSGQFVAATLATSWRSAPTPSNLSVDELSKVAPLLLESGGGALAWVRVRDSPLAETAAAAELQQAYRLHAIQSALHEINIKRVLTLFRAAGVEPLLVKGWAIARSYHEPGTRPYGDIDLCVRSVDYNKARDTLHAVGDRYPVDLHKGTGLLDDREWDELFARSRLVPLENVAVRVLAPEDHLRVLCFHLLRHGVERAIGLCDIGAAVESRPADFDWDVCLGTNRTRADWISCTVGLARQLLGADTRDTPFVSASQPPAWLVDSVLKAWGKPFSQHHTQQNEMRFYWHQPTGFVRALAARWPTPILGTVGTGGAFNELPRFPYQLGYLLLRSWRFVKQLKTDEREEAVRFFTPMKH